MTNSACESADANNDTIKQQETVLFDTWHFYEQPLSHEFDRIEDQDPANWASEEQFTWAGDKEEVVKTLFLEGVVKLGTVSEKYLAGVQRFCQENKYDTILSLGCERREDSYSAKGAVIGNPWKSWMAQHKHELTAFPTSDYDQGWHRDTPDDLECADHQITLMIYFTEVRRSNGATEFRRLASKDEVTMPGPKGTVVAFISSKTEHRGLANREQAPRVLMYVAYDEED